VGVASTAELDALKNHILSSFANSDAEKTVSIQQDTGGELVLELGVGTPAGEDWIVTALQQVFPGVSATVLGVDGKRRRLAASSYNYALSILLDSASAIFNGNAMKSTLSDAFSTGSFAQLDTALSTSGATFQSTSEPQNTLAISVDLRVAAADDAALDSASQAASQSVPTAQTLSNNILALGYEGSAVYGVIVTNPDSPSVSADDDSSDEDSGMAAGALAGIVIGVLAGFAVVAFVVWWVVMKKRAADNGKDFSSSTTQHV